MIINNLNKNPHTGKSPNTRKMMFFTTGIGTDTRKTPIFTTGINPDTRKMMFFTTGKVGFGGVKGDSRIKTAPKERCHSELVEEQCAEAFARRPSTSSG